MNFIKKHRLALFLLAAALLRLALLFLDFSFDVNNHIAWAKDLSQRGPHDFYDTISSEWFATLYPNYPPLALYIFLPFYPFAKGIFSAVWWLNTHYSFFPSGLVHFVEARSFVAGLMKLPAVITDFGIAWILYLFSLKLIPKIKHIPWFLLTLYLFNPAIFYNSSLFGQIDAIPVFFCLAAVYLALFTDRFLLSSALFTIGLLVKPTILIFLPIYAVFFYHKFRIIPSIKSFLLANILLYTSFLPLVNIQTNFFLPYIIYKVKILDAQSLPFTTNSAYNLWAVLHQIQKVKDVVLFMGVSYRVWGYVLSLIPIVGIIYFLFKYKDKTLGLIYALFLSSFTFIMFLTKMHERYFFLPLPFLLLLTIKRKEYLKWFYILSMTAFLNLYQNWPVPRIEPLVQLLNNPTTYTIISLLHLALLVYFYIDFIKQGRRHGHD